MAKMKPFATVFTCVVGLGLCVGSYFLGINSANGEIVTEFLLTQDVGVGHSLKGAFTSVKVPAKYATSPGNLVLSTEEINKGFATRDLFKNQPITKNSLTQVDKDGKRNIKISVPMTVADSVANDVKAGDIIALRVRFKPVQGVTPPDKTIISTVPITELRTSAGGPINSDNPTPGLMILDLTEKEASDIHIAMQSGTIYIAKYIDLSKKKLAPDTMEDTTKDVSKDTTKDVTKDTPKEDTAKNTTNK